MHIHSNIDHLCEVLLKLYAYLVYADSIHTLMNGAPRSRMFYSFMLCLNLDFKMMFGCMLCIAYRTILTFALVDELKMVLNCSLLWCFIATVWALVSYSVRWRVYRKNLLMTNIMVQCVHHHLQDWRQHQEAAQPLQGPPRHQDALPQVFYPLLCGKKTPEIFAEEA